MGSSQDRLPTLDERIQRARAEHSIRIGYAIGEAIMAASRFLGRKFRRRPTKVITLSRQ